MHEVERDVGGLHLPGRDDGLELAEERSGGRLRLHEPAHVVLHSALGEAHAPLLCLRQPSEGWQQPRTVFQNVGQSQVMVANGLACLVATEGGVPLSNAWEKRLQLHDVVDRGEHKHGQGALYVVPALASSADPPFPINDIQHASCHHDVVKQLPVGTLQEDDPLLDLCLVASRPARRDGEGLPVLAHAKGEGPGAVQVEAHEPVHGKEGTNCPLVLVIS
mmetsp:Transcript_49621/g.132776  ORF Transcript_49621/g.132776 Transcript_49621/m.132776 type:complete len:220 (-) Transcript_49621:1869-2528(-)